MKKVIFGVLALVVGLAVIAVGRTLVLFAGASDAATAQAKPVTPRQFEAGDAPEHLAEAISYPTISWGGAQPRDDEAFDGFAEFLTRAYPNANRVMERRVVNGHSLVYRWKGADSSKGPIGFLAHIDVVPVEPGTEDRWTHPPFEGVVADGKVWGRGALDDKGTLISIMEAAEHLAASGFTPSRDVYFLFGHDEEVSGKAGAGEIRKLLDAEGVHLAFTLDEGSGIVQGVIPGAKRPVALISTAEKGFVSLKFSANAEGGHSSAPSPDTAVSLVARAVVAVEDHPYPLEIDGETAKFLHALATELPFSKRLALTNLWLFGPLVKSSLAKSPLTAAALHTTTAPTMIAGGTKENVLPQHAEAVVNYRIHPRDSVKSVTERATRLVDDKRIRIEPLNVGNEPAPQSSTTSEGYKDIAAATAVIFGPISVAPSLTIAGTDSQHYIGAADGNYRFTPFIFETDDLERIHGTDERVSVENLARAIAWFEALITNSAG